MAKQTVNLGTSANKGDGDPLRTAFTKVNANFTEVYSLLGAEGGDVDDVVAPMLVHSDHTNVTVTRDDAANKIIFSVDPYDGDITGSVFGDDSTLLVDGVNNKIFGAVDTTSLTVSSTNVAIGNSAGETSQGTESVAIGLLAGKLNQGSQTIAIGSEAGRDDQGANGIALGHESGLADQAEFGIAIGEKAGRINQGIRGIGIGRSSGQTNQGTKAVAIGDAAGYATQGANAIAIGEKAGETNQAANSIVINATGAAVENTTASSLVITPIRSAAMTTILGYNAATGEVTHNAAIPGYISLVDLKTEVAASADFAAFKGRIAAL